MVPYFVADFKDRGTRIYSTPNIANDNQQRLLLTIATARDNLWKANHVAISTSSYAEGWLDITMMKDSGVKTGR